MNKTLLIFILLIAVMALILASCSKKIEDDIYQPIAAAPLIHIKHEHEHQGLACCPCGGCHHDEHLGHNHDVHNPWVSTICVLIVIAIALSILH
jgi:Mn2+/Fe2+ NRAMP family transporter